MAPFLNVTDPRPMSFTTHCLAGDGRASRWQWTVYAYPDLVLLRDGHVAGGREQAERAARAAIANMGGVVPAFLRSTIEGYGREWDAQGGDMPRYFFDVGQGEACHRDLSGINLPEMGCVWQIAAAMVDEITDVRHHLQSVVSVSVIVRDASDAVVYRSDHLGRVSAPDISKYAVDLRANI